VRAGAAPRVSGRVVGVSGPLVGVPARSSSATFRLTTTVGAVQSHPRAVDRGTPRSVAMVESTVRWMSSRSRWS